MTVRKLIENFRTITKVYDSIEKFQRKLDLVPAYNEMKEVVQMFEKEREKILTPLKKEGKLPDSNLNEANEKIEPYLQQEVELKNNIKFTKEEAEKSKITGSELAAIIDLIEV